MVWIRALNLSSLGWPRLHLHHVTELLICPIGLHGVKINQSSELRGLRGWGLEFFGFCQFFFFGWLWRHGAQWGKWAALSHDVGLSRSLGHPIADFSWRSVLMYFYFKNIKFEGNKHKHDLVLYRYMYICPWSRSDVPLKICSTLSMYSTYNLLNHCLPELALGRRRIAGYLGYLALSKFPVAIVPSESGRNSYLWQTLLTASLIIL